MNIQAWLHPEQKHSGAAGAAHQHEVPLGHEKNTTCTTTTNGRGRLNTEETLPRNNVRRKIPEALLVGDENPFLECHQDYAASKEKAKASPPHSPLHAQKPQAVMTANPTLVVGGNDDVGAATANRRPSLEVDCASTISSLSSGSFKQRPPPPTTTTTTPSPTSTSMGYPAQLPTPRTTSMANNTMEGPPREQRFQPPLEISFRVETTVPDWLQLDNGDNSRSSLGGGEDLSFSYGSLYNTDNEQEEHQQQDDNDTTENHSLQRQQRQKKQPKPKKHGKHRRTASAEAEGGGPLTPLWTGMPSPVNLIRPTLGRFKSVPATVSLFPGRTPRANASTPKQNNEGEQLNNMDEPQQHQSQTAGNHHARRFSYSPVVTPTPAHHQQQQQQQQQPHEEYTTTITPTRASLIIPVLRRRHTATAPGTPIVEVSSPRPSSHRRRPSLDDNSCCCCPQDQASYLDLTVPTLASSSNTNTTNNSTSLILSNLSWTTAATNTTFTTVGPKRSMVLQELKHILWRRKVKQGEEEKDTGVCVGAATAAPPPPKACHGCLA